MKFNFFLVIIAISFLFCCNKNNVKEKHVTLLLDIKNSQCNDDRFLIDSINIEYSDSLRMFFSTGDYKHLKVFHKGKNGIYEIRKRFNEEIECFGTDTILTFYKSDTIFLYHSAFNFVPIVFYYGFADCKYELLKENDTYKTIKQSLIDTTYKEIFFYDKDYKIYKFINTWKDNECVYVKK